MRPILDSRCVLCHGEDIDLQAGLDLRSLDTILEGGKSGPAIVPGSPEKSLLLQMVRDDEMPPEGKRLTREEQDLIHHWIRAGAP